MYITDSNEAAVSCASGPSEPPATPTPKKRGRGPGKKPRLFNTSIRLHREVIDYFEQHYPTTKQARMRAVLAEFVQRELSLLEGSAADDASMAAWRNP